MGCQWGHLENKAINSRGRHEERLSHPAGLGGPAAVRASDRESESHEAERSSGTREQKAWPGGPDVGRRYRGLDSTGEELDFTPGVMGSDRRAS